GAPSPRDEYYWIWTDCDAIRTAQYKLVRFADHTELYDLESDIAEAHDVAKKHPHITANLQRRLDTWEASVPIYPTYVPIKIAETTKAQPKGNVLEVSVRRESQSRQKQTLGLILGNCKSFQVG